MQVKEIMRIELDTDTHEAPLDFSIGTSGREWIKSGDNREQLAIWLESIATMLRLNRIAS